MEGLQIFAHGAILCPNWTHLYTVSLWESWHEFPIDLLYKDVISLDTKWRILASCPNSQYLGTLGAREVECPLWQWKNCLKLGKRGKKLGKRGKIGKKNREKEEKSGRKDQNCASWQMGLATLLHMFLLSFNTVYIVCMYAHVCLYFLVCELNIVHAATGTQFGDFV